MPTNIPLILSKARERVLTLRPYRSGSYIVSEGAIKLDRNENPLGPPQRVIKALGEALPTIHRYPPTDYQAIQMKIADYAGLKRENVFIGDGSSKIIDCIVKMFVDPGDEVIISPPTFAMYEIYTWLANGSIRFVRKKDDFGWDMDGIINSITTKTKLAFICSPNNPTGRTISEDEIRPIVEENLVVVLDEAYVEFARGSLSRLVEERENVIVLRTFSKAFGLAGLRIGYALAAPELVGTMKRVASPYSVDAFALVAGETVLDDIGYLEETKKVVTAGRTFLYKELNGIDRVTAYPSEANFLLVRIDGTSRDIVKALAERGVIVRDCSETRGLGPNFIRITVGTMAENQRLVEEMEKVLSVV